MAQANEAPYTVLTLLSTTPFPLQNLSRKTKQTSTKNLNWRKPDYIEQWEDFDYDELSTACGGLFVGLLSESARPPELDDVLPDRPYDFANEESLSHFFRSWTRTIVSKALRTVQRSRLMTNVPHIDITLGSKAELPQPPDRGKMKKPDLAGVWMSAESTTRLNILPGEVKPSWTFRGSAIQIGPMHEDLDLEYWEWPIRQIFEYCLLSESRYGYILTDEELVVVRLKSTGAIDLSTSRKSLEYAILHYLHDDVESNDPVLSVNLALYFIHLLGANDRRILPAYGPLGNEQIHPTALQNDPPLDSTAEVDLAISTGAIQSVTESRRAESDTTERIDEAASGDNDYIVASFDQSFGASQSSFTSTATSPTRLGSGRVNSRGGVRKPRSNRRDSAQLSPDLGQSLRRNRPQVTRSRAVVDNLKNSQYRER